MTSNTRNQQGFTIIELMIATTVLSLILLMATVVMIGIGGLYTKGFNQSNIQDDARNVIDDVSQNLQLNQTFTGPIAANHSSVVYCIGATRYTMVFGRQLGNDATYKHVLWRDNVVGGICNDSGVDLTTDPASTSGTEMMAPRARLTVFSICNVDATCTAPIKAPYSVTAGMAYGDTDLLCDGGTPGDCSSTTTSAYIWNPTPPTSGDKVTCKPFSGHQYCATSLLTTTIAPRL